MIHGCSINHSDNNTGYGLVIKNTGREMVSACNFYYSGIRLEATNGNVISACGFGRNTPIDIVGGTGNLFIGCMVIGSTEGYTPVTITNNTKTKFLNCYTRSGTEFDPRA